MKVELTRAGLTLQLEHGRQVFITAGDALPTTRGFFDTPAAAAAFAALVAEHEADGWLPSSAELRRRGDRAEAEGRHAAIRARIVAARACAAPPDGARLLLSTLSSAPRFEALVARVVGIDDDATLRLAGRGSIVLGLDGAGVTTLWLHLDDDDDQHHLFFGPDAGPPEGDQELAGTRFAAVDWCIEESPWDRFWFVVDDVCHRFELDGGVTEGVLAGPVEHLLVERICTPLDER